MGKQEKIDKVKMEKDKIKMEIDKTMEEQAEVTAQMDFQVAAARVDEEMKKARKEIYTGIMGFTPRWNVKKLDTTFQQMQRERAKLSAKAAKLEKKCEKLRAKSAKLEKQLEKATK